MAWPEEVLTSTYLANNKYPFIELDVGKWSYGRPNIRAAARDDPRKLTIGRYCSIGDGVEIFVGRQGRHPLDTLTTYPVAMAVTSAVRADVDPYYDRKEMFSPSKRPRTDNLDVVIGHDVWIGSQVMILAGVTIGTGAVIGARAVVSSDVPPFAIVAGAPAKTVRHRHEPAIVAEILKSEWWLLEPDDLWQRCGSLLNSTKISDVLSLLQKDPP